MATFKALQNLDVEVREIGFVDHIRAFRKGTKVPQND